MPTHNETAIACFDDWATTYGEDRLSPWLKFYQTMALSRLNLSERSSFLDVGCGTGWAVTEASKQIKEGRACGIDISPKMIAKAAAQNHGIANVAFHVASSENIPYPAESFTAVLCTCSFHHYEQPLRALSEMRRVMKKNGKLVILDAARDVSLIIWLQDRWRRYFERSHVQYYTTSEMKSLLQKAQLNLLGEVTTIREFFCHRKVFTGLMLMECAR